MVKKVQSLAYFNTHKRNETALKYTNQFFQPLEMAFVIQPEGGLFICS